MFRIMFRFWPFSRNGRPGPSSAYDPTHEDDADQDDSVTHTGRVILGAHSTCVYGYPSSGGVLVLPFCNGVDLSFLGLSRLDPAERSGDAAEEDRHCARTRKLGASWWFTGVDEYESMQYLSPERLAGKMLVVAAWPQSGAGVWVLTMQNMSEATEKGLGRVWNALSMDERCEAVEKLGGNSYHDPALCPDLKL